MCFFHPEIWLGHYCREELQANLYNQSQASSWVSEVTEVGGERTGSSDDVAMQDELGCRFG